MGDTDTSDAMDGGHKRDIERYRLHADVCKVLTDPKRLMLIDALRAGERSVGDLADAIGCSLPNASQHLAVLRNAGLVDTRRAGTSVVYHLAEPSIVEACDVVDRIVRRRMAMREVVADSSEYTPEPATMTTR